MHDDIVLHNDWEVSIFLLFPPTPCVCLWDLNFTQDANIWIRSLTLTPFMVVFKITLPLLFPPGVSPSHSGRREDTEGKTDTNLGLIVANIHFEFLPHIFGSMSQSPQKPQLESNS